MSYAIEGKILWSRIFKPNDNLHKAIYSLYLTTDDKTMLRLAEKEIKIVSVEDHKNEKIFCVKISCDAEYADQELPPPPVFDKEQQPISLHAEIPNGLKVKVKFDLVKGEGFNFGKSFMRLKAVMLLEDLPFPFDNVESF